MPCPHSDDGDCCAICKQEGEAGAENMGLTCAHKFDDVPVATLVDMTLGKGCSGTQVDDEYPSGSAAPVEAASASQEDNSGLSVSQQPLGQMATAEMLAAEAIQIQELQRQLAAAEQRIQQLQALTPFGEDFKMLAQQEAAEYTTIATNALKDAEEATGSKAVQKARQLLEAEPSPRNAALALAERTMSATRAM